MKRLAIMLVVLAVLACLYVAYPYWSARRLGMAFAAQDPIAVDRLVDWPSVRASFKANVTAQIMRNMQAQMEADKAAAKTDAERSGAAWGGLALALAPAIIDKAVEAYMSPQGLVGLGRRATGDQAQPGGRCGKCLKRFGLVGPTRFEFEVGPPDADAMILGVMELQGVDWKLTQLVPLKPLNEFAPARSHAPAP